MKKPATIPEITEEVRRLLATGRDFTVDELVDELEELGLDLGVNSHEIVEEVLDDEALRAMPIGRDRVASLPALLEGRTFTHEVSKLEVELGFLNIYPDFEPISILTEDETYRRLADGTPLVEVLPDYDAELLAERGVPPSAVPVAAWLLDRRALSGLGVAAGELVSVTVRPDGFELDSALVSERAGDQPQRWAATFPVDDSGPSEISGTVWLACADDPELFRTPVEPLGELFAAAGLEYDGDWLATAGFDFAGRRVQGRLNWLQETHRIGPDEALTVAAFTHAFMEVDAVVRDVQERAESGAPLDGILRGLLPDRPDRAADPAPDAAAGSGQGESPSDSLTVVRELLPQLEVPAVARALLAETLGAGRERAASLGVFADSLLPEAPRSARPALHWLRGRALERLGDVLASEQAYDAALTLDPDAALPLYELARFASDRGDAERGLSLLRRAGAPADDELVGLLEAFRPVERRDLGRNSPCWCGSGRKYKVCHMRHETLPLSERAAWLYQKAGAYLQEGPWRPDVLRLAEIRAQYWTEVDALLRAFTDPLVCDVLMFEGGAFAEFLKERGDLLPDDERLLAEQWLLAERSLYEVETVTAGSGFTARDIRTGDKLDVRERTASRQLKPGMIFVGRLVPAGDTVQCFGGIELVDLRERDELIALLDSEPEPDELVAFLTRRFAPPVLLNTENEPSVMCEAVLRCADPEALTAALDAAYERTDDEPRWHETITTQGESRIRATLMLGGDELTVETNSEIRMDRVLGRLRDLDVELELLSDIRRPFADLAEAMRRTPGEATAQEVDPTDPAIAAAIAEMIRGWEATWLDEHIPALAGLTPREAAADPTRRPDLIRLLDSFGPGGPGQMDPQRLRDSLGL